MARKQFPMKRWALVYDDNSIDLCLTKKMAEQDSKHSVFHPRVVHVIIHEIEN